MLYLIAPHCTCEPSAMGAATAAENDPFLAALADYRQAEAQ
jgi:hypothetical protein